MIQTLDILSILIIVGYAIALCLKEGKIPYSISATYFALDRKKAFSWCLAIPAILLIHPMLLISETLATQALSMLMCVGLLGVALYPDFKDTWENKVHCTSAAILLISSQLWVILMGGVFAVITGWLLYLIYTAWYMLKHSKGTFINTFIGSRPMFWIEITALSIFFATKKALW